MKNTLLISLAAVRLLVAQPQHYTLTDLGPVGPYGQPFTMSDNGLVAGAAGVGKATRATLWYKGQKLDIGNVSFGGANSTGFTVNVKAQMVGQAEASTLDPYGEDFCGYGTQAECLPFLWQFGLITPLSTLGGRSGVANWINTQGQIAGFAENTRWDPACPPPQKFEFKPVVWNRGQIQELPIPGSDKVGGAFAINDSGQIIGASGSCSTYNPYALANFQPLHALLWQTGSVTDIGNLGGTGKGSGNVALGINNKGQVVGNSDLAGDEINHAFLWQNGQMTDLGTLPGDVGSAALAINDSGAVVGVSLDPEYNARAVVIQNGVMLDLNELIPADSSLYLLFACSINAKGDIDGQAVDKQTGDVHGFLLTHAETAAKSSVSPALQLAPGAKALSPDARRVLRQRLPGTRFGVHPLPPQ